MLANKLEDIYIWRIEKKMETLGPLKGNIGLYKVI